jgi:hypothetical protein
MIPENYASPMADARAASRRRKPASAKTRLWGDETK